MNIYNYYFVAVFLTMLLTLLNYKDMRTCDLIILAVIIFITYQSLYYFDHETADYYNIENFFVYKTQKKK